MQITKIQFNANGDLIEIVRSIFTNLDENALFRDYEDTWEWVIVKVHEFSCYIDFYREHDWGKNEKTYPIYAYVSDNKGISIGQLFPKQIILIIEGVLNCNVLCFSDNYER